MSTVMQIQQILKIISNLSNIKACVGSIIPPSFFKHPPPPQASFLNPPWAFGDANVSAAAMPQIVE